MLLVNLYMYIYIYIYIYIERERERERESSSVATLCKVTDPLLKVKFKPLQYSIFVQGSIHS